MKTVVITDGKYRASIAAARVLGRAGYQVVVTQTRADESGEPPVFSSRYVAQHRWIDGAAADRDYPDRLLAVLGEYSRPVLLCAGAASLNAVSARRAEFEAVCDLLVADPEILDALNDKEAVHRRCLELGIPVPVQYRGLPDAFPVVVKPHCGEKFGLKAAQRYGVAHDREEYERLYARMSQYDSDPIVQERIVGDGEGVSLLLGRQGELLCALCHRRIREYPMTGGPSTCCVSFYDETMIAQAHALLRSFGFQGLGMVEFKGGRVLEVNPRIWGSFPLTEQAGSPMALRYVQAACGRPAEYAAGDYAVGVRMRFLLNDAAAALDYLRHGRIRPVLGALCDLVRAREALGAKDDRAPLRKYWKRSLLRR